MHVSALHQEFIEEEVRAHWVLKGLREREREREVRFLTSPFEKLSVQICSSVGYP